MKVKDLIEKLQACDPDAEVIGYNYSAEMDFFVNEVDEVINVNEEHVEDGHIHYCGDFSVVLEECMHQNIVYLTD